MKKTVKKPQGTTSRESDKFILRLPAGMRDKIAARAATNGRSMNSEIIAILEPHIEDDEFSAEMYRLVEDIQKQMKEQQARSARLEDAVSSFTKLGPLSHYVKP